MRFRRQVVTGHAALVAVVLFIGAVATLALRTATSRLERVAQNVASDMIAVEQLRYRAEQVVATSRGFMLSGDPQMLASFEEAAARVDESLSDIDQRRDDLSNEVAELDAAAKAYITSAKQAAQARSEVDDVRELLPQFERTLRSKRERFEQALNAFAAQERASFDQATRESRRLATEDQAVVTGATMAAAALAVALAWLSIRRLSSQYAQQRAATEAARQATEARDEILAVVSHDLRNPLTTITMAAHVLTDTVEDPAIRRHAARMRNAATRMDHLIEQLLDVTKLEHGKLELARVRCDVPQLLDTMASLFEARAVEQGVELQVEPAPAAVDADRERAIQILSNLVGNALKFTPHGGRIRVVATPEAGFVRFEVIDNGSGIAPDIQPHLFERYVQGKSRGRGSLGLGLYICKQLVLAHGGDIGVQSTPGEGSTFWFTLPIAG